MSSSINDSFCQISAGRYFPLRKGAASSLPHLADSSLASHCPFKSPPVSVSPWEERNEEYRSQICALDLRKIETDFAHMDASALETLKKMCLVIAKGKGDIYSIAPEIVDPRIPLKKSLTVERSLGGKKTPLKMKKEPQYGMCGKVKFVRFKGDPVFGR